MPCGEKITSANTEAGILLCLLWKTLDLARRLKEPYARCHVGDETQLLCCLATLKQLKQHILHTWRVSIAQGQRYMVSITDFTASQVFSTPALHFQPYWKIVPRCHTHAPSAQMPAVFIFHPKPTGRHGDTAHNAAISDDLNVTEAHRSALMRSFHFSRKEIYLSIILDVWTLDNGSGGVELL